MGNVAEDPRVRFWRFIVRDPDAPGDCWLWVGGTSEGYGRFRSGGKGSRHVQAHRFAYETFVGPIPEGHHVHHDCRERLYVNPGHLRAVTPGEHLLLGPTFQALNAAKTHCKNGHAFTPRNTRHRPTGGRACRRCNRERQRRQDAARR